MGGDQPDEHLLAMVIDGFMKCPKKAAKHGSIIPVVW
jgi:hypothetical protein